MKLAGPPMQAIFYVPIDFTHEKPDNVLAREGPTGPITPGELAKKAHKVITR